MQMLGIGAGRWSHTELIVNGERKNLFLVRVSWKTLPGDMP